MVGKTKPKETISRKQRKELKGLTRAGRLAYFKKLRENWSPEELAAWKESWKRKKETWNKRRQSKPEEDGVEEQKESEPPRKKQRARKSQPELMQVDDGSKILHV